MTQVACFFLPVFDDGQSTRSIVNEVRLCLVEVLKQFDDFCLIPCQSVGRRDYTILNVGTRIQSTGIPNMALGQALNPRISSTTKQNENFKTSVINYRFALRDPMLRPVEVFHVDHRHLFHADRRQLIRNGLERSEFTRNPEEMSMVFCRRYDS